jgi:hypothetical protein
MKTENGTRPRWWQRFMDWLRGPARDSAALIEPELAGEIFVRREKE